ncbi:MAG TPA: hypothetical protein VMG12_23450 [Polyangiaceae bacterium]|nr:hypothetical protein [Polyangiaceae bacterium]
MRHLHALIIASGLCVPSLALAAAPVDPGQQRPAAAHVAHQATPTTTARAVQTTPAQTKAAQDDRARYAAKEAKSGEAKDYRGGDTVVIGASAATAILAVILLIVLI